MFTYKNISGKSGISYYSTTSDSIIIQFNDGATYIYNYLKPGKEYVERMKALAITGKGLNSLISRVIKKNYYLKIK